MKQLFSYLAATILLLSCEQDIPLNYPAAQENLVLNAHLKPGDTLKAFIGLSVPYQDLSTPPYINNGNVSFFKNGQFLENAVVCKQTVHPYLGDTMYEYCINQVCETAAYYEVRAIAPGFDQINGSTYIPQKPLVSNVSHSGGNISFTLTDNKNEKNYYFFEMFQKNLEAGFATDPNFTDFIETLSTYDLTIEMLGEGDEFITEPSGENIGKRGFLTDEFFVDGQKEINFRLAYISTNPLDTFKLRVVSCSQSFYEYSRSVLLEDLGNDNPFAEPYQFYSNVSNGYGLVGSSPDTVMVIAF